MIHLNMFRIINLYMPLYRSVAENVTQNYALFINVFQGYSLGGLCQKNVLT